MEITKICFPFSPLGPKTKKKGTAVPHKTKNSKLITYYY